MNYAISFDLSFRFSRVLAAAAAATALLSACGSDNSAKPTAPQAAAIAAEVSKSPPVITVQPVSKVALVGGSATFTVTATGEALNYQWLSNGEPVPKAAGPSLTTFASSTADSGTRYAVRVSNAHGEVTSEAAVLSVAEAMFAN